MTCSRIHRILWIRQLHHTTFKKRNAFEEFFVRTCLPPLKCMNKHSERNHNQDNWKCTEIVLLNVVRVWLIRMGIVTLSIEFHPSSIHFIERLITIWRAPTNRQFESTYTNDIRFFLPVRIICAGSTFIGATTTEVSIWPVGWCLTRIWLIWRTRDRTQSWK